MRLAVEVPKLLYQHDAMFVEPVPVFRALAEDTFVPQVNRAAPPKLNEEPSLGVTEGPLGM